MRRYLLFSVAAIVLLLSQVDATAVSVAYPEIIASFDISLILAGWILSSYQLVLIAALPLAGKISDALGRKNTFIGFLALFTTASFLCSIAPNAPSLIFFRMLQGLGGSGFLPSAVGLVSDEFSGSRQKAIGLLSSIFPAGSILGPNIGGAMTTVLGWRSIFWINIPLGVACLGIAALLMPAGKRGKSRMDLAGAGLIAATLTLFMAALSQMGTSGTQSSWISVGLLLVAAVGGFFLFWRRQRRVEEPVIDPEVLHGRPFVATNIFNFAYGCTMGVSTLVPLYAVSVFGMSTLESGVDLTPRSAGMMGFSAITSFFLVRWGYRWPLLLGTLGTIPGMALLALRAGIFRTFGIQHDVPAA